MKNKLTYILLALLTLAPMAVSAKKIYLNSGGYSLWSGDNARFAAYFYNGSNTNKWVSMTHVTGDVFEVTVPTGTWPNVIFCRMNPANNTNSWDTKWNQTNDLTVPTGDAILYTITGWGEGKSPGNWSNPTTISLDYTTLNLTVGVTSTLKATVTPSYVDKTITWTSSKESVATVSSSGVVTTKAEGTTIITAKANGKSVTCTVNVAIGDIPSTAVTISATTAKMIPGTSLALTAEANGTNSAVTWSTTNGGVATVVDGIVTAVAAGTATITATAADGSGKSASCIITVVKTYSFTINFYTTWTNPKLYWWDSPTQTGKGWPGNDIPSLRTSKGEGWWEVHFTDIEESAKFILNDGTGGDKKQTDDLTVAANHTSGDYYMNSSGQLVAFVHVTGVTLNKTTLTLKKDATETLSTTFAPTNATVKDVTWESSDTKVATVASNGKVTAVAPGTATITVTTKNNGKTATCTVTVPSTEVTISKTSLSMVNGTTATLTATANGPGATINWTSSNQTVATISSTGVITAKAVGSTTITATASDNNTVKATCTVTVTAASVLSTTVTITNAPTVMRINEVLTLTATTNGTNQNVTWSTSNANVIAVAGGTLTAKAAGTATITATAADGSGKKATCTIAVYPSVKLYVNTLAVEWGDETNIYYFMDDGKSSSGFATPIPAPAHALTTGWYEFDLPISDKGVTFIVRKSDTFLDGPNTYPKPHQTKDVVISAAEVAAAKANGLAYNVPTTYSSYYRDCTPSTEHTTARSFIYSTDGVKDYYSNRLTADGTFSYYVATTHTDYGLYTGNEILGYTKKQALSVAQSNVYTQTYTAATKTTGAPVLYTGDYYINSAATAAGTWTDFSTLTDAKKTETEFTPYTDDNKTLYYWVKWIDYNKNVNGFVGNPYNPYLSEVVSDDWVNANGRMPKNGSVRYQYNPVTNELQRTLLDGSTENTGFLKIYSRKQSDKILSLPPSTKPIPYADAIVFSDVSDWVYEVTIYAHDNATATVTAKFNGKEYCLFGLDGSDNEIEKVLRNNDGQEGALLMRVIYDFKTNRMIGAWQMKNDQIQDTKTVNSNVLITRRMNEPATQVTFKDGASKLVVYGKIYTQLEILKTEYTHNGGFLWISLPYDCYLKDVYGIDGYGTKWTIQRYRGDKRAAETYNKYSGTFWRDMNNKSATAKLEAGRGYVVHLNLTDGDFSEFSIMNPDSTFTKTSALRLYFPSADNSYTFSNTATSDAPAHNCTISPREKDDSNWNVIGVTGLHDMTRDAGDDAITGYYTWAWDAVNKKGVYTPVTVSDETTFASTMAYMTQYTGTISWVQSAISFASYAPRRVPEVSQTYNMQLDFTDGNYPVRTFINLNEQGTKEYDLNRDMGMIINEGIPQIYTLTGVSQLAINNLPVENQSVQLGVQASTAGNYTFSMENVPAGIMPVLYDAETGNTVNLRDDSYTVYVEEGTDEQRFILQIKLANTPTNEQLTTNNGWNITQLGNSLLISGLTEPADVCLFDVLGRLLYQGSIQYETIPITAPGIYLLSINGNLQRVLAR